MQVSLAIVATLGGLAQWLSGAGTSWLAGALLIFAVIPFTLVVILPTNNKLLEPGRDKRSEETRRLLEAWGRLHAVRSLLSLAATSSIFMLSCDHGRSGADAAAGASDGLQLIRNTGSGG
jgi:hypothetical protein